MAQVSSDSLANESMADPLAWRMSFVSQITVFEKSTEKAHSTVVDRGHNIRPGVLSRSRTLLWCVLHAKLTAEQASRHAIHSSRSPPTPVSSRFTGHSKRHPTEMYVGCWPVHACQSSSVPALFASPWTRREADIHGKPTDDRRHRKTREELPVARGSREVDEGESGHSPTKGTTSRSDQLLSEPMGWTHTVL